MVSVPRIALAVSALVVGCAVATAGAQHVPKPMVPPLAQAVSYQSAPLPLPGSTALRRDRVLTVAGGALLGAGLGFFASHLALSNWDDGGGAEASRTRLTFAVGGATLGALGGFAIGGRDKPGSVTSQVPPPVPDRNVITIDEVLGSDAVHALELIERLRNSWLTTRGMDSFREFSRGQGAGRSLSVTPGEDRLVVYLDQVKLGGPDKLREIPTASIESLRFFDATAATYRWGGGHSHGAILVTTRKGR